MSLEGTVVITGGNGFVGKHLVDELIENWPKADLVVWDKNIEGLSDGVRGVEVDITRVDSYRRSLAELQPEWVVHLAAVASVGAAERAVELTRMVNVEATENLLTFVAEQSGESRVLAVSSADIYGKNASSPLPEFDLKDARPQNVYAESKLAMEKIIEEKFCEMTLRVRPFPHIGPGQGLGFVTADFASQIAAIEAKRREPVIKVGNLDTKRDFTDVRDVVRAYRLLMEKGEMGEVYNIASEKAVPMSDILQYFVDAARVRVRVVEDKEKVRLADVAELVGSAKKLREATGWSPTIPLERSLSDILRWWRDREGVVC